MANIFKTTLKKDVIADIANNNVREIRFPITKFWATRLADEYNLDEKEFTFKTFDSLELSSPSNKDAEGATYTFEFIRTFVDGEEFVVEFKEDGEGECDCCPNDNIVVNGWAVINDSQHFKDGSTHSHVLELKTSTETLEVVGELTNIDMTQQLEYRGLPTCSKNALNQSNCNYEFKKKGVNI